MANEAAPTNRWITTEDNPYDPFNQWDLWYSFDEQMGYCTCEYLARIVRTSPEFDIEDQERDIDDAIDEIMRFNLTGNYKIVTKNEHTKT